ncbi:hypothetical protein EDD11_005180 [Mortierella claussenii]|nr:hypothetical protein EDD11_005180 [Mortierella claussenii]
MGAGSGSSAAASSSRTFLTARRPQQRANDDDSDTAMAPPASQQVAASQSTASASQAAASEPQITYPRSLVASMKPTLGAYTPHLDSIKKGLQYITDSTIEYEEFHGDPSFKMAGVKDVPAYANKNRKPASRSKAILAAFAEQEAFSQDPQIHLMEEAMQAVLDMQHEIEAEKQALDGLAAMVSMGGRMPGKDLLTSFEVLLKNENKLQQTKRKQDQKMQPTPGGVEHELWEMRKKVWEVHHGHDPLPTSGASGAAAGGGDDDEDDDMEIVVTSDTSVQSLKCPLTTNFLEDPVTSSLCKHSFSRVAVVSFIQTQRGQTMCPVHGCNRVLTMNLLQPNKALARKVARQILIQQEISQREDEEYTTVD